MTNPSASEGNFPYFFLEESKSFFCFEKERERRHGGKLGRESKVSFRKYDYEQGVECGRTDGWLFSSMYYGVLLVQQQLVLYHPTQPGRFEQQHAQQLWN